MVVVEQHFQGAKWGHWLPAVAKHDARVCVQPSSLVYYEELPIYERTSYFSYPLRHGAG